MTTTTVMKNCVICGTGFDGHYLTISCSDVCKRARKSQRERDRRANRTDEQIAEDSQRARDRWANRTDEQIAEDSQRGRDRRNNMTDEQIAKEIQREKDRRANMTDEQHEKARSAALIRYRNQRRDTANFGLPNAVQEIINQGATQ